MLQTLDAAAIEKSLRLEAQQPCGKLEWLEDSYRKPREFWRSLQGAFDARAAAPRASALFSRYNFYHDIVVRNLHNPAPALSWYDRVSGFRNISYTELGNMVAAKAGSWVRRGLKAGNVLCIIRTMGLEMAVELLAALKIGCRISFLLPQGKGFLQRRLSALKPDYIVTNEIYLPLLSAWSKIILTECEPKESAHREGERVFTYPSGQAVFLCFSPCGPDPHVPVTVTSDAAYLCALRDGLIALGLGPGDMYAAPGFHGMETFPSLLLAGWICGATYLHLSPKAIAEKPELVAQLHIKAFGVSKKVRDILLEKQVEVGESWESWFRNPAETADMEKWHYFIRNLKLEKAYSFNLRWDAALGGCLLCSARRKGMAHMNVMPAPGSAWSLGDLSGGAFASPAEVGVYCVSAPDAPEKKKRATADIIAKSREEWVFAGVNAFHREGRIFPMSEVLKSLQDMEARYKFFCSVVDVPRIDSGGEHHAVLLVFRGVKSGFDEARLSADIRSVIAQEMGSEFQPDRIEFFPLFPRFLTGTEVDHQWCRGQYLTGTLFRRAQGEIFHCTTLMRDCVMKVGAVGGNVNRM